MPVLEGIFKFDDKNALADRCTVWRERAGGGNANFGKKAEFVLRAINCYELSINSL
jgi:hypothetical protein